MYMFFFGSINQFVHGKFLNMASMWVYENKDRMSKMQHKGKYNIYFLKDSSFIARGKHGWKTFLYSAEYWQISK